MRQRSPCNDPTAQAGVQGCTRAAAPAPDLPRRAEHPLLRRRPSPTTTCPSTRTCTPPPASSCWPRRRTTSWRGGARRRPRLCCCFSFLFFSSQGVGGGGLGGRGQGCCSGAASRVAASHPMHTMHACAPPVCRRLSEEDFRYFRRLVIRIILSTDMAAHHDGVEEFAAALRLWGPDLAAWAPDKRAVALQVWRRCCCGCGGGGLPGLVAGAGQGRRAAPRACRCGCGAATCRRCWLRVPSCPSACRRRPFLQLLVHAADISNPARPLRYCCQWGHKVHEEFFVQGEGRRRRLWPAATFLSCGPGVLLCSLYCCLLCIPTR